MLNRLVSLALLTSMTSAFADVPAGRKMPPKAVVPFAAKLAGRLANHNGNLLYSPASISIALAMTREGASGATAAAMDRVLGADAAKMAHDLTASFKTPKQEPDHPTAPELTLANRLFGDKTTVFEKPFLDVTSTDYGAPAESVDFRGGSDAARIHINDWVATQTRRKIKDLIPYATVNTSTRMVLVNAIYMKASWSTAFDRALTRPASFAIDGMKSKQVDTMHMTGGASWGAHHGARTVDLPYYRASGPQLAMLVVVPDGKSLAEVEAAYAAEGLQPFLTATSNRGLAAVAMPKFEVGTSIELSGPLTELGMGLAFSGSADFSGMSKVATRISAVVHQAWAKVDEDGTEAAAATAVVMGETSVRVSPTPHAFDVDRSFLFFIHDDRGNVLFGGRIVDPTVN